MRCIEAKAAPGERQRVFLTRESREALVAHQVRWRTGKSVMRESGEGARLAGVFGGLSRTLALSFGGPEVLKI
jgi:hypothetical protein